MSIEKQDKIIREFKEKFHSRIDYFTLDEMMQYIDMAYCVGYDEAKINHVQVIRSDGKKYYSIRQAAKDVDVNERNIRRAILNGWKCRDYNWKIYHKQPI